MTWVRLFPSVVLVVVALALPSSAQEKQWRLGYLSPGPTESRLPGSVRKTAMEALAEQGFLEGRNLELISLAAEGDVGRLPQLAEKLAQERVDVVIAVGALAARAARSAAPNTPVVLSFSGEDPVKAGLAASLARPGGVVTGIYFQGIETDAKRLELLREALPRARVLGFLASPTLEQERAELLAQTAAKLGVTLTTRIAHRPSDYSAAFEDFKAAGAQGVLVMATTFFGREAPKLSGLAMQHGMATICEWDYMARQGCVMGYGADLVALRRLTADYVARIFNGASAADLPIQQPNRFVLAVNVRAAMQLKIQLPTALLLRADEVIE
jgi:putative ABC transport system substrate-binding protein